MLKRLITTIFLVAILLPLLLLPYQPIVIISCIVFGFLAVFGSIEILNLTKKDRKYNIKTKIIAACSTSLIYFAVIASSSYNNYFNIYISFGIVLIVLAIEFSLLVFDKDFMAKDMSHLLLATLYPAFGLGAIIILRLFDFKLVIYLLMITSLTDAFAYMYGMLFGKHKMASHISPKKTWEGSIAGSLVATTVAGLYAVLYGNLFENHFCTIFGTTFMVFNDIKPIWQIVIIIVLTIILSIASQIGDLVASKLKRSYDVKDYSQLFPGHGGVMDRFDSSIFAGLLLTGFIFILYFSVGI